MAIRKLLDEKGPAGFPRDPSVNPNSTRRRIRAGHRIGRSHGTASAHGDAAPSVLEEAGLISTSRMGGYARAGGSGPGADMAG